MCTVEYRWDSWASRKPSLISGVHGTGYGQVTAMSVCKGQTGKAVASALFPSSRKPKPPVKL